MNVTLGEMLNVGELQVHLSQPYQNTISGCFKLLSLTDEVLQDKRRASQFIMLFLYVV